DRRGLTDEQTEGIDREQRIRAENRRANGKAWETVTETRAKDRADRIRQNRLADGQDLKEFTVERKSDTYSFEGEEFECARMTPNELQEIFGYKEIETLLKTMGPEVAAQVNKVAEILGGLCVEDVHLFKDSIAGVKEIKYYVKFIIAMLKSVSVLFTGLGKSPAVVEPFKIVVTDPTKVISEKKRKVRSDWKDEIRDQLNTLFKKGIIRYSNTDFHSATVIAPKKNGKLRLCVDYRKLNKITVGMGQILPLIHDLFRVMEGMKYFTVLDLTSGYHQIPMAEDSIKYTSFVTEFGQYEYTRLPFGLKNAPPFFQDTMNRVLSGLIGTVCCVYLDDIVVFGRTMASMLLSLFAVLIRLKQFNMRVNLEKTVIGAKEIEFLG
ncbi:hypothetical protein ADUPG1_005861, partial [Aduncisulcus paluster]